MMLMGMLYRAAAPRGGAAQAYTYGVRSELLVSIDRAMRRPRVVERASIGFTLLFPFRCSFNNNVPGSGRRDKENLITMSNGYILWLTGINTLLKNNRPASSVNPRFTAIVENEDNSFNEVYREVFENLEASLRNHIDRKLSRDWTLIINDEKSHQVVEVVADLNYTAEDLEHDIIALGVNRVIFLRAPINCRLSGLKKVAEKVGFAFVKQQIPKPLYAPSFSEDNIVPQSNLNFTQMLTVKGNNNTVRYNKDDDVTVIGDGNTIITNDKTKKEEKKLSKRDKVNKFAAKVAYDLIISAITNCNIFSLFGSL